MSVTMNKPTILKSLSELPQGGTRDAEAPWAPEVEPAVPREGLTGQDFRELLDRRYNTPFPYPQWGLNE